MMNQIILEALENSVNSAHKNSALLHMISEFS